MILLWFSVHQLLASFQKLDNSLLTSYLYAKKVATEHLKGVLNIYFVYSRQSLAPHPLSRADEPEPCN